jgi:hypothetical protein
MAKTSGSVWIFVGMALACTASAQDCGGHKDALGVVKFGDAVAFSSPVLNVDADGAPNAYRVDGQGLSHTCDGVVAIQNGRWVTPRSDKANWEAKCNAAWKLAQATGDYRQVAIFGFATGQNNRPRVQQDGDPLPGLGYVSTTSVEISEAPQGAQRRYVDSNQIPYVVLPSSVIKKYVVRPADLAIVYRPATGAVAFAVHGDQGGLGEGSIKLHMELGSDPMIQKNGVMRAKRRIEDRTITVVFPGRSTKPVLDAQAWTAQIHALGSAQLAAIGGIERLKSCQTSF